METKISDVYDESLAQRRRMLKAHYEALPIYASAEFWRALSMSDLPLEVIVRCLRLAVARADIPGRNRLLALIIQRTQSLNEQWVRRVLTTSGIPPAERPALADDLYADLCECMLRALLDPQRHFWEENFLHCLYFERKHVHRSFMGREGRWFDPHVLKCERVPRSSLVRLDATPPHEHRTLPLDQLEDEQALAQLQSIDLSDLLRLVLRLPPPLKAVLLLIFWEGWSEKETAHLLGITDRTVRNRLRKACTALRTILDAEKEQMLYV